MPRGNDDEHFSIRLPNEPRFEFRVPIGHTTFQWKMRLRQFHYRCAYCGCHQRATPERHLVREHIMPVSRNGTDQIENVVPACRRCNERKGPTAPGEVSACGWLIPEPRPRQRKVNK